MDCRQTSEISLPNSLKPKPGHADRNLVSMTADVAVAGGFNRIGDGDPSKWIDALTAPAICVAKTDLCSIAVYRPWSRKAQSCCRLSPRATNRTVLGSSATAVRLKKLAKQNIVMNRKLNGLAEVDQPKHRQDAIDRFQAGRTAVLLFPGEEFILARPVTGTRIAEAGEQALTKFGGSEKVYKCIRDEIDANF